MLAAMDSDSRMHVAAKEVLAEAMVPLVVSPFVLAELDYLLTTRIGVHAALDLLREIERGAYRLEPFPLEDVGKARARIEQYASFGDIGLADASNIVLAERYDTLDILTLDERHFRTVSGPGGRPFRLLPADF